MKQGRSRGTIAALLLPAALLLLPAVAAAHQRLLGTTPSRDSAVDAVPRELRMVFSEPAQVVFTTIRLTGPDGRAVTIGELHTAPDSAHVLVVPITGHLAAGDYVVHWATASRDGHPVQGEFGFTITADAEGFEDHAAHTEGEYGAGVTAPGQPPPDPAHHDPVGADRLQADAPAYVAVRWANYLGILGVIGAVSFRLFVLGALRRRRSPDDEMWLRASGHRAASLGVLFAAFTLLAGAARLYAQSVAMHGSGFALDSERLLMMLQRTVWGWAWLLQMGTALLAAAGFVVARRLPGPASGAWGLAALAALGLAVTPALSGHAAAMTGTAGTLAIVTHTLHVLAAAGWLGTLLILLLAGVPAAMREAGQRGGNAVAHMVRAFSPAALLFAGLLVASGVFAAILHSASLDALVGSRYGNLLFVKVGIFLLVVGTGAYNFLKVKPSLGSETSTRRLRRSATIELAAATAVLLVTAVLVATARPYEEDHTFAGQGPEIESAAEQATDFPS